MAVSPISPIVKCKRPDCGRYVVITIETFVDDSRVMELTRRAAIENAYCDFHRKQKAWYSQQGRLDDWEAGRG